VNNHGTLLNINWQSIKVSLYGTKEWKGNAIDSEWWVLCIDGCHDLLRDLLLLFVVLSQPATSDTGIVR